VFIKNSFSEWFLLLLLALHHFLLLVVMPTINKKRCRAYYS